MRLIIDSNNTILKTKFYLLQRQSALEDKIIISHKMSKYVIEDFVVLDLYIISLCLCMKSPWPLTSAGRLKLTIYENCVLRVGRVLLGEFHLGLISFSSNIMSSFPAKITHNQKRKSLRETLSEVTKTEDIILLFLSKRKQNKLYCFKPI